MARRSPWINLRTQQLLDYLKTRHQLTITEGAARESISKHVDEVAVQMRINRQGAKFYLTEETIHALGNQIATHAHALAADATQHRQNLPAVLAEETSEQSSTQALLIPAAHVNARPHAFALPHTSTCGK